MVDENIVKPTTNPTPVAVPLSPEINATPVEEKVEALTDTENTPKEVDVDSLVPSDDYRTSPMWYEVVSYFGIPQEGWDGAKNEISTIVDYVIHDIKSNDVDKILLKLRELENKLQPPTWGEKRWKVVYRYIRLAGKKQATESAMKAFEKENYGK